MYVDKSLWKFHFKVFMLKKTDVVKANEWTDHKSSLACYCLQLQSDRRNSTFASHLNSSGKARGCRQDSTSINDYLQQVSPNTVSSDLSLWRKQSMDCCSAQSDVFFLPPAAHQTRSKAEHVRVGGARDAFRLLPFPNEF